MGMRAYYSFKLKDKYINNVYQQWGAEDNVAIKLAVDLFSAELNNLNDVVELIEDCNLLELHYFYEIVKEDGKKFQWSYETRQKYCLELKNKKNIFSNKKENITKELKEDSCNLILKYYLFDLDNLKLRELISNKTILNYA